MAYLARLLVVVMLSLAPIAGVSALAESNFIEPIREPRDLTNFVPSPEILVRAQRQLEIRRRNEMLAGAAYLLVAAVIALLIIIWIRRTHLRAAAREGAITTAAYAIKAKRVAGEGFENFKKQATDRADKL